MGVNDPLTREEINQIADEVVRRQESEESTEKIWWKDKRKRGRVILVALMLATFFGLETFAHMGWSHRLFEICTDCIADFILFGSIE